MACGRSALIVQTALFVGLCVEPAAAKECGDRVGSARVACACGDTVISDTILQPGDPVVSGRCHSGGLVVRAPELAETLRLDLNGLSLIGSGVGDGITVESGGSDGAVIVGGTKDRRGEVVGFGTGINVRVARAARRIEALNLEGQRHEGMMLRMAGAMVFDVKAEKNGGDGIRVYGQGGRLLGIESRSNHGTGIRLVSRYTIVAARVEDNRVHGMIVRGSRNDLRGSSASNNRGYGIVLGGQRQQTEGVVTEGNSVGTIGSGERRRRP